MEFETINFRVENRIARIGLNRPAVFNALNRQLIAELDQAIAEIHICRDIRALILIGEGDNFAAGADIAEMVDLDTDAAADFSFNPTFSAIAALPVPVIAAIDGYALGGGLELALACDIRICTQRARFGMPEITVGIFPGAGGTQRLPALIGQGRARELIYTGRLIDADTAIGWGLCNERVDDLEAAAYALARRIAAGPPLAMTAAKMALQAGTETGFAAGMARESLQWADLFSSRDQKEGMRAFLAKRKPVFEGE